MSRYYPTSVSRCLSVLRVPVLSDLRIPVPVCDACPGTIRPAYPGACLSCVSCYYPTCVSRCLSVMRVPFLSGLRIPVPVCDACPVTIRPACPGACLSCVSRYYPTCVSRCLSVMRVPVLSGLRIPVPVCDACPVTIRPAYSRCLSVPGACLRCVSRHYPTCVSRCLSVMRVPVLSDLRIPVPVCDACPVPVLDTCPGVVAVCRPGSGAETQYMRLFISSAVRVCETVSVCLYALRDMALCQADASDSVVGIISVVGTVTDTAWGLCVLLAGSEMPPSDNSPRRQK